jgi:hypothetical protein
VHPGITIGNPLFRIMKVIYVPHNVSGVHIKVTGVVVFKELAKVTIKLYFVGY